MSTKVHARKFVGHNCRPGGTDIYEEYEPLCGAKPIDPMFSDAELDCLRCKKILDRGREAPHG